MFSSSCSTASSFNLSDLNDALPKITAEDGLRYDPPSFHHIERMNKEQTLASRLAQVPSQYQLESLQEVYCFDMPCLSTMSVTPVGTEEFESVYPPSEYNFSVKQKWL